jgi:hypothetical protein
VPCDEGVRGGLEPGHYVTPERSREAARRAVARRESVSRTASTGPESGATRTLGFPPTRRWP